MGICKYCGVKTRYNETTCQTCRKYFREGGVIHQLPEYGTVKQDNRGYYICFTVPVS